MVPSSAFGKCNRKLKSFSYSKRILDPLKIELERVHCNCFRYRFRQWFNHSSIANATKRSDLNTWFWAFPEKTVYPLLRRSYLLWPTPLEFKTILGSYPSGPLEFRIFTDFKSFPPWNSAYFWRSFVYPNGIPLHFKPYPLGTEMDLFDRWCMLFFWTSNFWHRLFTGTCGKVAEVNDGAIAWSGKTFTRKLKRAISILMWVKVNKSGLINWFANGKTGTKKFYTKTEGAVVPPKVWTHVAGTFDGYKGSYFLIST